MSGIEPMKRTRPLPWSRRLRKYRRIWPWRWSRTVYKKQRNLIPCLDKKEDSIKREATSYKRYIYRGEPPPLIGCSASGFWNKTTISFLSTIRPLIQRCVRKSSAGQDQCFFMPCLPSLIYIKSASLSPIQISIKDLILDFISLTHSSLADEAAPENTRLLTFSARIGLKLRAQTATNRPAREFLCIELVVH